MDEDILKSSQNENTNNDLLKSQILKPREKTVDTESSLKNNGSELKENNFVDNKNSLNKILFIIFGMIIILALVGVGIFFVLSKNNKINIKKNTFVSKLNNADQSSNNVLSKDESCKTEYNKLLSANKFDFDKYCINHDVHSSDYNANTAVQKKKNLVLIFDASGSMAAKIDGKRKIDIAKEAAWKFIDQIATEKNLALSIIVYGHKGNNSQSQKAISCAGIDEIYYLGDVDAEIAKAKLNKFDAIGWTPIAGAFQKAKKILADKPNDENFILLVSDGKEMCDGDPIKAITTIKEGGFNIKADVIGFDVDGEDENQLKAIAKAGDGDYFSVSNAVDLDNAFAKHKKMLDKANFKIGHTLEQLSDVSFIINNYNQCLIMLKKEEAVMMLDIHAKKILGADCEQIAQKQYEVRVNKIKHQLDDVYKLDMEAFNLAK